MAASNGRCRVTDTKGSTIDAVVIGRNEGARLLACLGALSGQVRRVVYVDSGSTDGSVDAALAQGARTVPLDMTQPFTAARARNAGLAALADDPPDFVLFLDGDTRLQPGFPDAALTAFSAHPAAVVVCGRRQEVAPQISVYNRLIDREWDTPLGLARACGGDALMRFGALVQVGGFNPDLIAGEEPDLCLRLQAGGGQVWRIAAEMTLHDAAITHWRQWARRSQRAGHAFAEGWALHGFGHWGRETLRALIWGAVLPLVILGLALVDLRLGGVIALIYPLQWLRLARRGGMAWASVTLAAKFAEARGVIGYLLGRLRRKRVGLIEYK